MRGTKLTFFIILTIIILTQTIAHFYVKFIIPKESILDKYKDPIDEEIESKQSIEELDNLYIEAKSELDTFNEDNIDNSSDEIDEKRDELEDNLKDIRNEINNVERKGLQLVELLFYWFIGLILIISGILIYQLLTKWIGTTLLFIGIGEMAICTSPLFNWSNTIGFDFLLNMKLLLSFISLLIIIFIWIINEIKIDKK
jgi:hypothetical protein